MRRIRLATCGLVFIVVFLWGYQEVVVPVYAYSGFVFIWPGLGAMAWGAVISLLPLSIIPIELEKPSVLILWWLYITAYVPSILMPLITLTIPGSTAIPLQLSVLCSMMLLCAVPYVRTLVLASLTMTRTTFWWLFGIAWSGCVAICLTSISLPRIIANFALLFAGESEYVIRAQFESQVIHTGISLGYAGRELCEALDPFLMAFGSLSKRWWMVAIGVLGQLIYFGQVGMKEVPFSILLMFAMWLLYRWNKRRFGVALILAAAGLVVLCTAVDLSTHSAALSTQFTRRTLAGPGLLTGFYFEHYSTVAHPGHSFGSGPALTRGPSREIGFYYFGTTDVDANANFWAEGFAEYGVVGIFLFAAVIALCLWIYDSIASHRSLELALLLAVIQADALTNTSPLTVLVTHGGILGALLLYFTPEVGARPRWNPSSKSLRTAALSGV